MITAEIIHARYIGAAGLLMIVAGLLLEGAAFGTALSLENAPADALGKWGAYAMGAGAFTFCFAAVFDYIQTSQIDA